MDQLMEAMKRIENLKPLETVGAKELGIGQAFSVLRVMGGYIFMFQNSSCFVPEPKMEVELQSVISGSKLDDALKSGMLPKKTKKAAQAKKKTTREKTKK